MRNMATSMHRQWKNRPFTLPRVSFLQRVVQTVQAPIRRYIRIPPTRCVRRPPRWYSPLMRRVIRLFLSSWDLHDNSISCFKTLVEENRHERMLSNVGGRILRAIASNLKVLHWFFIYPLRVGGLVSPLQMELPVLEELVIHTSAFGVPGYNNCPCVKFPALKHFRKMHLFHLKNIKRKFEPVCPVS